MPSVFANTVTVSIKIKRVTYFKIIKFAVSRLQPKNSIPGEEKVSGKIISTNANASHSIL